MKQWRDWEQPLSVTEQVQNKFFCNGSDEVSPAKKRARKDSNHDPIVIQMMGDKDNNKALGLESISSSSNLLFSDNNVQVDSYDIIISGTSSQSCTESGFCTVYDDDDEDDDDDKHGRHGSSTRRFPKIWLEIPKRSDQECSSKLSNSTTAGIVSKEVDIGVFNEDVRGAVSRRVTPPSKSAGKSLSKLEPKIMKKRDNNNNNNDDDDDDGNNKKRNDDLHKLIFLPKGLPDGTYLAYKVKGQKLVEGYKKGNGIFCNHCSSVISPSQFEAHAKMSTRKKPYQHIFDDNGVTLHEIAISLSQAKKNHIVDPSWRKPRSKVVHKKVVKSSYVNEYGGNCVLCPADDFSVNRFDDRSLILCDQCGKEHHVGCLREAGICDLKEVPKEKWFCCHDCERIFSYLRNIVARGPKEIPSSMTKKINKKLLEKGLCKVSDRDVRLLVLNGKSCLPKHHALLAKVIYLFRKRFDPILAPSGRDLIPLMVHGKSEAGQEFGGMYCLILTVKTVVVSTALLRVCGRELAEIPLLATRKKHEGKGYFMELFSCIENLLGLLKVEKLALPAAENAKAMWLDRFGFTEMSQDKLDMYMRMFGLTVFCETVMLVKQVEQHKS